MKKGIRIVINAPVILGFTAICAIVLLLSNLTDGESDLMFFCVYRCSLKDPFCYIRLIGHVFGHANLEHLMNNCIMILMVGPLLEEKYGSKDLCFVIFCTALVTGLVNFIFFPQIALMGASGVVFALILLSSMTGFKDREIPLTFLVVALFYLGQQVYDGLFVSDQVSQLTHIVGGIVGALFGYLGRPR